jgi:hypothetical protein
MEINVAGLVVLFVFYVVILIVGILAARRKKMLPNTTAMESSIVAGRDLSTAVGIFTMTGTVIYLIFNYFFLDTCTCGRR